MVESPGAADASLILHVPLFPPSIPIVNLIIAQRL